MRWALVVSAAVHLALLSLTLGGENLGLPSFGLPWQERRGQVPELQARLALPSSPRARAPTQEAPPGPTEDPAPSTPRVSAAATLEPSDPQGPTAAAPDTTAAGPNASPATHAAAPAAAEVEPPTLAGVAPLPGSTSDRLAAPLADAPADPVVPVTTEPAIGAALEGPPHPRRGEPDLIALNPADTVRASVPVPPPVPTPRLAPPPADPPVRVAAAAPADPRPVIDRAGREGGAERAERAERAGRADAARLERERSEAARIEREGADTARVERERAEAARLERERAETARLERERAETARVERARAADAARMAAQQEAQRLEALRQEAQRQEVARLEQTRQDALRLEAARQEAARAEAARLEAARAEAARQAAARAAEAQARARREEDERREAIKRAIGRQLDEEAARRDAQRRGPEASPYRRGRLFGRTDSHVELVLYAEAWARRIQLNTDPELVRDAARQPHRAPLVTVAIRRDGSVESVSFVTRSGVPVVDEAVRRTVEGLAPYPAFPPALARDFDVVEIRRTWTFDSAIRLD